MDLALRNPPDVVVGWVGSLEGEGEELRSIYPDTGNLFTVN